MRLAITILTLGLAVGLAGCGDKTSVTRFEPGVYKGARDDPATMTRSAEQKEALDERFATVQMDR